MNRVERSLVTILLASFLPFQVFSRNDVQQSLEFNPFNAAESTKSVVIGGQTVSYRVKAAMMPIHDRQEELNGHIFYVAYTREGIKDISKRPLLFSFNGGPGSSSVWLHMGFLGPRRVVYDDQGFMLAPPFTLTDNEYSILDEADLVFIDPIGTGYSRMSSGKDPHMYHGVNEDIESIAEFIRLYCSRYQRWLSPKFIIGESYGTTRAAGLTAYLQSKERMYINGTILLSAMNLGVNPGEDLRQALLLPHYAATAWHHKRLAPELQALSLPELLLIVEPFSLTEYAQALIKGNSISFADKKKAAEKLEYYTGIAAAIHLNHHLRLDRLQFRRELLAAEGLIVGRLDSRYTAARNERTHLSQFDTDPAMNAWNGPFTAVLNHYLRRELGFKTDRNYAIFGDVRPWRGMAEIRVGEMLHQAMIQNPYLKVLVMAGYFDGATDHFTIQYAMNHLDPAGLFKDRVDFAFYECGHMMYLRKTDLIKAKRDLADFIRANPPKQK